ncbi:MAG: hypothetical protein HQL46_11550 [Gammaproteobacteria bacterium]|nr:hypothetical protein [Gammaproteobacteria bacterium]
MEKENNKSNVDDSRRKFLETAGKAAAVAPAAALLLSAKSHAAIDPYSIQEEQQQP